MKILVSGNSGSGKSSLGKRLSQHYDLPLYGLDKVVWQEGWVSTPKDERVRLIREIISKDSWVLEGITRDGLREADIIYFLDIHPVRCAYNVINRFIRNGFGTRVDLPENCPEYKGVLISLKINFIFNKVTRPWLVDEKQRKKGAKFIRIKNYKELKDLKFD